MAISKDTSFPSQLLPFSSNHDNTSNGDPHQDFFLVEDLPQLLAGKILLFLVSGRGD